MKHRPATVLFVSDTLADGQLVTQALAQVQAPHEVVQVSPLQFEGLLLSWTTRLATAAGVPRLVVIDTSVPTVTHYDVVRTVRATRSTRHTPVLILAERALDVELRLCYEAGANSFLCKPASDQERVEAVATAVAYWLLLNLPPSVAT